MENEIAPDVTQEIGSQSLADIQAALRNQPPAVEATPPPDPPTTPPADDTPPSDAETPPSGISREDALKWFADNGKDLTHDDLKVIEPYNQAIQKHEATLNKRMEQVKVDQTAQKWESYFFNEVPEPQRALAQQTYPNEFAMVQNWRRQKAQEALLQDAALSSLIYENTKSELGASPEFAKVDWDKLQADSGGNPVQFFTGLAKQALADERKAIMKAADEKATATINEWKAKNNLGQDQPDNIGGGAPGAGGNAFDFDHYMKLPAAEAIRYKNEHEGDLAEAINGVRGRSA